MISRDEFIAAGWSQKASVSAQVVDVHMSQSRKLLKQSSQSCHSHRAACRLFSRDTAG
ncbi:MULTISPECIES: helix-turn-helix domain-containing protein [unclassified Mesorhizobium]|uniref:helix-turn-helix domain-containing protein n=2 Tax=unclassified Mesorhizobium TaxID=325217 RepID=UPI0009FEF278